MPFTSPVWYISPMRVINVVAKCAHRVSPNFGTLSSPAPWVRLTSACRSLRLTTVSLLPTCSPRHSSPEPRCTSATAGRARRRCVSKAQGTEFSLDMTTVKTAERMSVVEERGELVAWGDLVPTSMHQSALRPPAIRFRRPVASEGTGGRTLLKHSGTHIFRYKRVVLTIHLCLLNPSALFECYGAHLRL